MGPEVAAPTYKKKKKKYAAFAKLLFKAGHLAALRNRVDLLRLLFEI
jgi:hypothetical protein